MIQENLVTFSNGEIKFEDTNISPEFVKRKFKAFFRNFQNQSVYVYRDQLKNNLSVDQYFVEVKVEDLGAFDETLCTNFIDNPSFFLPLFEEAAKDTALSLNLENVKDITEIQITLSWNSVPISSNHISKLICLSGIVIKTSRTQSKVTQAFIQCLNCKDQKTIQVKPGFSGIHLPNRCEGKECPNDSYSIITDKCKFIDFQSMKLQESPEMVPTGEIPRTTLLNAEKNLVEKAPPGTRVKIIGIYSTFSGKSGKKEKNSVALRYPYVRVLGIDVNNDGSGRSLIRFNQSEENKFIKMSKNSNIYESIASSIDPAIFGHENIKKAIACQLFGGSSKLLPDGTKRRGDINVLLLGDPSMAKSQILKFAEKVAPIGVYTSGKGSSAAGLTASVIKEPVTNEFYLEGGAMVLADGGLCCIDEFDKMRTQDRVAIHEAMEQQTISIAKAGITTVLNSRTSVLAAANPVFGRYDDLRSPEDQIDFQTTILSRFDMIFLVKDLKDSNKDGEIARHVLNIHKYGMNQKKPEGDIQTDLLKRYIAYCRFKCSPRLSKEAAELLKNHYVKQRSNNKEGGKSIIPITVRQLEALIRISESLARMRLSDVANEKDALEAIRLFSASTLDAINTGIAQDISLTPEAMKQVEKIEELIKKRLPLNTMTYQDTLVSLLEKNGHQRNLIEKAIFILCQRKELEYKHQRNCLSRKK